MGSHVGESYWLSVQDRRERLLLTINRSVELVAYSRGLLDSATLLCRESDARLGRGARCAVRDRAEDGHRNRATAPTRRGYAPEGTAWHAWVQRHGAPPREPHPPAGDP